MGYQSECKCQILQTDLPLGFVPNREYLKGCACGHFRAKPKQKKILPQFKHHSYATYIAGCRCDICKEAVRVYQAERRAKINARKEGWIKRGRGRPKKGAIHGQTQTAS